MGWMLRNQILHHGGKEADHVGEKSTASPCGAKKWNNKLDSSNKTNKSETWWPNQFNNLCNTSGAAHPISFLPILLSFVFKEYTAEHFSLFSAQTYLFLLLYTFSLTIDGMFLWVTGSYNIWLCCSSIDPSGEYVWMRRISGWGSALSLCVWRGTPSHPFPWCLYFNVALFLKHWQFHLFANTIFFSFAFPWPKWIVEQLKQQIVTICKDTIIQR